MQHAEVNFKAVRRQGGSQDQPKTFLQSFKAQTRRSVQTVAPAPIQCLGPAGRRSWRAAVRASELAHWQATGGDFLSSGGVSRQGQSVDGN